MRILKRILMLILPLSPFILWAEIRIGIVEDLDVMLVLAFMGTVLCLSLYIMDLTKSSVRDKGSWIIGFLFLGLLAEYYYFYRHVR